MATPPAITLLLAASRANYAVASSGGSNGGSSGGSGGGGGNAPLLGDPPTNTQNSTNSPTGASAAGQSCGNTFQALADNDKCFR